jgi:prefoldin subunit 5
MNSAQNSDVSSIPSALKALSKSATALNTATHRLTKSVEILDDALRKLNLGISSWVDISFGSSPDERFSSTEQLGYAKVNGKWGLALKVITEDEFAQGEPDVATWLFCDASRDFRIRALPHLPKLIAQLDRDAESITAKLSESAKEAEEFARAIETIARNESESPSIEGLKRCVVAALLEANSQGSAAAAMEDAIWSLDNGTIRIKTTLSKTILPLLINPQADKIIRTAVHECAAQSLKVELQPAATKPALSGESK